MQRHGRASARVLASAILAGSLLGSAGFASAQAPGPGGPLSAPALSQDATAKLIPGPKGEVYRLTQVDADPKAGGGSLELAVAASPDSWKPLKEIRPTEKGASARDGELAVGPSGEIALVYRWWRNDPRAKQVRVAKSDDGGKTWVEPATPVDTAGKAFDPRVAWTSGKSIVVVWSDERRDNRVFDIYARRSADGGVTWEPEQLLSRFDRNGPRDLAARPILAGDGDRLWAVWIGVRGLKSYLFLNRSVDGGKTWTAPMPVSGESRSVFGQTLVRAGNRMLLVWQDTLGGPDRIYAATSSDAGVTWSPPERVDHLPAEAPAATAPAVLLGADGEALVAWHDGRNGRDDIYLARSSDGGRTWAGEDQRMDMDEPGTGVSRFPRLARASDGRVALAWEDDRAGHESSYVRIRTPGPKSEWGPEILVGAPTPKTAARIPNVAWGPGGLYVIWQVWDHTFGPGRIDKSFAGRTLTADKP